LNIKTTTITIWLCALTILSLQSSCAIHDVPEGQTFSAGEQWVLLPIQNFSEEPLAGERAENILDTLLRSRGIHQLTRYPDMDQLSSGAPELDERKRLGQVLIWAKGQGFQYGFSGSIAEWRYKSGLDAEPAVGITLQIFDIATGQIIWSSSSARSGWGRESLSGTAQKVLRELVDSIEFN